MIHVEIPDTNTITVSLAGEPDRILRSAVRAMNRAVKSGRQFLATRIAEDTGLKTTVVREAVALTEASFADPQAILRSTLKRIPLEDFGARGPIPTRGRGRGVTANTRRRVYPDLFRLRLKTGHVGVFGRVTPSEGKSAGAWSKNLPIQEKFGPSIGRVFTKYRNGARDAMLESFEKNFDHELSRPENA